jgi:hypothetical protein
MSSSNGDPSRKIPWYRQMLAKFENENKVKEVARRNLPKETTADRRKATREDQIYNG